jgi:hypothetical protein
MLGVFYGALHGLDMQVRLPVGDTQDTLLISPHFPPGSCSMLELLDFTR